MKIKKDVLDILSNDWDPIGINNDPKFMGEYDGYASRVVGMLYNGSSEVQIAEYLNSVVTQDLELPVNENLSKKSCKETLFIASREAK